MDWKERERLYFMDTGHRRLGITLVRGQGAKVWDDEGNEYLDFIAGWAVNNLGHCHPAVVKAINQQSSQIILASYDVYTIPSIQLAELLVKHTGLHKVFIANSGAEANEAAVKLARKYGKLHLDGAYEVITALNSFHGHTLAMVAATGKPAYQAPYTPLPEGFLNVEYNNVDAIKRVTTDKTCAVMLEPIQGEGGVIVPDDNYLRNVRQWCDDRGLLLILDEVQTGFGRTGALFAYQWIGVEPYILTLGKGLGGGVPISAVVVRDRAAVFGPGHHGSTFGGNALCSAAAYASFRWILDHDVAANALNIGEYFMERLKQLQRRDGAIAEVRGKGLLIAVEFQGDIAMQVVYGCRDRGLLVNLLRANVIRFMPPLIITRDEVNQAMGILEEAMENALMSARAS